MRGEANSANWIDSPQNRWGFVHVRELTRTARIGGSPDPVQPLPRSLDDISAFEFDHLERRWTFGEMLDATFTDALMVVRDGAVLFEHYGGLMRPTDTHLLMSVSKSLTSTLAGVLVGLGLIDTSRFVPDYIPSLRGTSWEGCTLQHLLDMRAGTRFDEEDYANPDSDGVLIEQISGYRPRTRPDLPADTYAWIAALDNERAHGGPFEYRSILTDVLAWVAMEATGTRFPELFSRRIWSRIGAEHDADIIVDAAGFPVVEGGICTTLRDLARFGLMHLQDGEIDGRRVVPAAWIARLLQRDNELIAAFDDDLLAAHPHAFYHDQWWIWDGEAGIYSAYGINGQQLLIHRPSRTVIARFSTWPERSDERLFAEAEAANRALLAHLAA
jgi:CubicO group peptidase (beta-lactamase class C family)